MKNLTYLFSFLLLLGCEKLNLPRLPIVSISQPEKIAAFADKWKLEGRVEVDDDDSKLTDFDIHRRGFELTLLKSNTVLEPFEITEVILNEKNTTKREDFEASTPNIELNQDYSVLAFIEVEKGRIYSDTVYFNTASSIQLTSSFTEKDLAVTLIGSISGFEDGDNIDEYGHCWIKSDIPLNNPPLIQLNNAVGKTTQTDGKNGQYEEKPSFELGAYYYVRPYAVFNGQEFYGLITNEIFLGNFWEELAPYDGCTTTYTPIGCLFEGVGFSLGKKGYIGTGRRSSNPSDLSSIWEYDTETEIWKRLEGVHKFPGASRNEAIAFTIGETAYIGGGKKSERGAQFKDFYAYRANIGWERIDNFPIYLRSAVAFVIGDYAYVGTGRSCTTTSSSGCVQTNRFFKFSPLASSGQQWTEIESFPLEIRNATAFSLGGKGYVVGGVRSNGYIRGVYEFNPDIGTQGTWTRIGYFLGSVRQKAVAFTLNGKGYIGTGTNINIGGDISSLYDFFEFTPPSIENPEGSWKQVRNMGLNNRDSAMSFVIKDAEKGDKAYVYGGAYYNVFQTVADDLWIYTPDNE